MRVGDLVKYNQGDRIGIIIDWHIIYNRFGDPVEKYAAVKWQGMPRLENEFPDMLEVINEKRRFDKRS